MTLTFRPATIEDSFTAYQIFYTALASLWQRKGLPGTPNDNEADAPSVEVMWQTRRSLFEHLARTAEHFWLAEVDGLAVGYARSILRENTRELTEFFVLPDQQSGGVGRGLLNRAFPVEGADHRMIIATLDSRAQALYLRTGVSPHFPACYFELPEGADPAPVATDLDVQPVEATPETLAILRNIDRTTIGHGRDADHTWLLNDRQGFVYYRRKKPVGYGYAGHRAGPFALLKNSDFPAVLSHAQRVTREAHPDFGLEAPLINRAAVEYLLANGYRMDGFYEFFMCDKPFGKFENYIFTSPPLFL
jgi:GNAT superfamily N-acetyltransferase